VLGAAAELALHKGDDDEAADLLARSVAAWKDTQHVRSQAFWLASQAGVWLAQGNREACYDALPRFMELYRRVRRHCDQDQTTARLVRILEFVNQAEEADQVLHEYLGIYRRGLAPLSAELCAICERKGLPVPASARTIFQAPAA
jgi:ATP/maltotriose-dependent transcriptional regulator MalT